MKAQKVLVVSDIHLPYHDPVALATFLSFLQDFKPNHLVLNGDILDLQSMSSHGDPHITTLVNELRVGEQFLNDVKRLAPRNCKISFNEGNHEARFGKYISAQATPLQGLSSIPQYLALARRNIDWRPYGELLFLSDKLAVTHGTAYGANYARDTLVRYGMSVVVGHAHRPQMHLMGAAGPDGATVRGCFGLGTLAPVQAPYLRGPSGHTQGWGAFFVRPDGTFTPYIINLNRGGFTWADGSYYGPKK